MEPSAIDYVLNQTRQNILFLQSAEQISPEDTHEILEKLTKISSISVDKVSVSKAIAASRPPPPIPSTPLFNAKAKWAYNEEKRDGDLTFAAGDIIEIVDTSNSDWWKGRLNSREGLCPSSYVERLPPNALPARFPDAPMPPYPAPGPGFPDQHYTPQYSYPSYPPQTNYYGPPPHQNGPFSPYHMQQPAPPPPVIDNQAQNRPDSGKQGFFSGKLGNTLARSAVGGVGFGAGSAIGGNLVNSIF